MDNRYSVPSYETELPLMAKSIPVWRMAVSQVSPSIPTHIERVSLLLPDDVLRVGTVNVPVTEVKDPYVQWYP